MNKGQRRYKIFGFTKRTVAILTTVVMVALVFLPTSSMANSDREGEVFPETDPTIVIADTDPQSDTPDIQDGAAGLTTEPQALSLLGEPEPDPADILPFAAGDMISLSQSVTSMSLLSDGYVTYPDRFGGGLAPLVVNLYVTLDEAAYTSGGTIELPLDYFPNTENYPDFDTPNPLEPFFIFSDVNAAKGIVTAYDTTSKPGTLIIRLKGRDDVGYDAGLYTIPLTFDFNENYKAKIPGGGSLHYGTTLLWEIAPKAYVDDVFEAAPEPYKLYGGGGYKPTFSFGPYYSTNQTFLDTETSLAVNGGISYNYEGTNALGLDPSYNSILWFEVPAGMTGMIGVVFFSEWATHAVYKDYNGSGYDRYEADMLPEMYYGNGGTSVQSMALSLNVSGVAVNDSFFVRGGIDYKKYNYEAQQVSRELTYTKIIKTTLPLWDLRYDGGGYHNFCGVDNGLVGDRPAFPSSPGINVLARNAGSGDITGVKVRVFQNNEMYTGEDLRDDYRRFYDASARVRFNKIFFTFGRTNTEGLAIGSGELFPWSQYRVDFTVKNALTEESRKVSGTPIVLSAGGNETTVTISDDNSEYPLPACGANEYIESFDIVPLGTDGTAEGVLPPGNYITYFHIATAWDDLTWPNDTPITKDTLASMGYEVFYHPEGEESKTEVYQHPNVADSGLPLGADNTYYVFDSAARAGLVASQRYVDPGATVPVAIIAANPPGVNTWKDPRIVLHISHNYLSVAKDATFTLQDASGANLPYTVNMTYLGNNYYSFTIPGYGLKPSEKFKIVFDMQLSTYTPSGSRSLGAVTISSIDATSYNRAPLQNRLSAIDNLNSFDAANWGFDKERGDHFLYTGTDSGAIADLWPSFGATQYPYGDYRYDYISVNKGPVTITAVSSVKSGMTGGSFVPAITANTLIPTSRDEEVQMKLTVRNSGNASVNNIRLYDILPQSGVLGSTGGISFVSAAVVGDTGSPAILYTDTPYDSLPKYGSYWTNNLNDPNLQTSTFQNTWQTSPSANTTAVFVDLGAGKILLPGESVEVILTFRVPSDADTQTAFNQFRYSATEYTTSNPQAMNINSPVVGFSTDAVMIRYDENLPADWPLDSPENMPDASVKDFLPPSVTLAVAGGVPLLRGAEFLGWYENAQGTGSSVAGGTVHTFTAPGVYTLYAKWRIFGINIRYDLNGSEDAFTPASGSTKAVLGQKISPHPGNPTRPGHKFEGWYETAALANAHASGTAWDFAVNRVVDPILDGGTKVLYAGWSWALPQTTLTKSADPPTYKEVGEVINYELKLKMPSDITGYGSVRIEDELYDSLDYVGSGATLKIGDGAPVPVSLTEWIDDSYILNYNFVSYSISADLLAANDEVVLMIPCRVLNHRSGNISNTGGVYITPAGDVERTTPDDEQRYELLRVPDRLTKTAAPSSFKAENEVITYKISIPRTSGLAPYYMDWMRIVDEIPAGLSYVEGSAKFGRGDSPTAPVTSGNGSISQSGNKLTFEIPGMDLWTNANLYYDSATLLLDFKVTSDAFENPTGALTNTAKVYVKPENVPAPTEPVSTAKETVYAVKVPDITKTASPDTVGAANERIAYALSFTLPDDVDYYDSIRIVDILPPEMDYVPNSVSVRIGSAPATNITYASGCDFSAPTAENGNVLSFTVANSVFKDRGGQTIRLALSCDVNETWDGETDIVNMGELYVKTNDSDWPDDPDKTTTSTVTAEEKLVPPVEDFEKTASPGSFTKNDDIITYAVSFKLPADVSGYDTVRIEDVIPSGLAYQSSPASTLKIGTGAAQTITMNTAAAGKVSYTIPNEQIAQDAEIVLTMSFKVNGWTSGNIKNTANLYVKPKGGSEPGTPDKTDEETITPVPPVEDFEKTASPGSFTKNDDIITYAVSFKLPADVSGIGRLRIVDLIPNTLTYTAGSASVTVGGSPAAGVSVASLPGPGGTVSVIIPGTSLTGKTGQSVEVKLSAVVNSNWTSGNITNTANLYIMPKGGSEPGTPDETDEETVVPAPPGVTYYHVWYHGNGNTDGTAPADGTNYTAGGTVTVQGSGTLTRADYTFLGWSADAGAAAVQYAASSTFSIYGDTNLYAVWSYTPPPGGPDTPPPPPPPVRPVVPVTPVVPPEEPEDPPVTPVTPVTPPEPPVVPIEEPAEPEAAFTPADGGSVTENQLDAQTGNIFRDLANGNVPRGDFYGDNAWSLLSLILSLIAVITAVLLTIAAATQRRRNGEIESYNGEEEEKRRRRGRMIRVLAIVAGVLTLIVWLILDDLTLPMVWVNKWTILVAIVFIVHLLLTVIYKVRKGQEKGYEEDETLTA
ncbi:hypothetical protein AGMMS49983_02780 [Clostridia bacterium]|nr:hypothetical protein AGMMS49983_02780 [Clostridia bacterium]